MQGLGSLDINNILTYLRMYVLTETEVERYLEVIQEINALLIERNNKDIKEENLKNKAKTKK